MKTLLVQSGIDPYEAKAIALLLMEKVCGMTTTDVLTGLEGTAPTPQELQALAAKRAEDNDRLDREIAARKQGAVSYEEYLKMKSKNEQL